jgi:oleate hydratase
MRNYDRVNARRPAGVEQRRAYIVGGGIAGLSAAAFLSQDGGMPAENVTILEALPVAGGSLDGAGDPALGYISRGERELEPNMECLWALCAMVPSLDEPGRTVLDETRESNQRTPIHSRYRLTEKQFRKRDCTVSGLTRRDRDDFIRMILTPEPELEDLAIDQWFQPSFYQSNFWHYGSSMLAFQPCHSLVEMRRYMLRFMQHLPGVDHLRGVLHTKYNQFESLALPLIKWLQDLGVRMVLNAEVADLDIDSRGGEKVVTAIRLTRDGAAETIAVGERDLVLVTNGSLTQNSTSGSMTRPAVRNDDAAHRGCFTLWEKLATRHPEFGRPAKFLGDPEKTHFVSWTLTLADYPGLVDYLVHTTGNEPGSGGAVTMVDSAWFQTFHVPLQPVFRNQPANVQVLWGYGLYDRAVGNHIRKPMSECTGEEILREFLHHLGLAAKADEIAPHANLIPTMLPYVMSQFMPRARGDRPDVIPPGSKNLAFIGQFVEIPGDVVFTVETSVRTAMAAVYGLLNLDKPVVPIYAGQYDVRVLLGGAKKVLDMAAISPRGLARLNPLRLPGLARALCQAVRSVPDVEEREIMY